MVFEENIKYHLTSTANQNIHNYRNISTIKLGECENILKDRYNISQNDSLLMLKLDIFKEGLLPPVVEYELYHPKTKQKLNLDYCENYPAKIIFPISLNENELYKYDPKNEYYYDICITGTSKDRTDITLKDRQNEYIDNNLSLCEVNCSFSGYDNQQKKVSCDCLIKIKLPFISEIVLDKEKFRKSFTNINAIKNLDILKCYKTLFKKEGLISNVGSYIILSISFLYLIACFLFFIKGFSSLINKIKMLLKLRTTKKKLTNKKNKNQQINESSPYNGSKNIRNKDSKKKLINVNNKTKIINKKIKNVPPKKIKKSTKSKEINNNNLKTNLIIDINKQTTKFNINNHSKNILINNVNIKNIINKKSIKKIKKENKNVKITLKDRQNEYIDNNLSLCEPNCDFIDYNNKTKK